MNRPHAFAAALLGAALLSSTASPASALPVTEVIEGEHLRLISIIDPAAMQSMLPGDTVTWDVSVSADAPDPGTVDLTLSGDGSLPLLVDASVCARAWTETGCRSGETALLTATRAPLDGGTRELTQFRSDETMHVRLHVTLPDEGMPAPGTETRLRVHAHGYGDALSAELPGGPGELPRTGMPLGGAALLALVAIAVGLGGASLGHRREAQA